MLIINAEVVVEPEAVASAKAAIEEMEIESLKEPGCDIYAFSVDINNPSMIRITERWHSMADLEAHFQTPHMAKFSIALGKIQPSSMNVKLYEIARELPLPGAAG